MGLYWIPPGNRFMCSRRSRMCGIMRGAIDWKYSASSPLVMPSAGKRTLSGWVMVIACPSMVGIVADSGLAGDLGRRTARRFVRLVDRNARRLEDGGDKIRLGEGPYERSLPIDHGVGDAPDAELVREVREFVRLDADRFDVRRGQCH